MKFAITGALIVVLLTASLSAKFATTKVTLTDTASGRSIEVTDPAVLKNFNVWSGPGTYSNGIEATRGFIIDWPEGVVSHRPNGLHRYQVTFFVNFDRPPREEAVYVVFYEFDPSTRQGFVYLPGKGDAEFGRNVRSIIHKDFEGHWFHPTEGWQKAIDPMLPIP